MLEEQFPISMGPFCDALEIILDEISGSKKLFLCFDLR